MKEKIYTIPVNDAFDHPSECPFCELEKKLERETVSYCLGSSMMDPDAREESDKRGFCRRHYALMIKEQKALSFALVLDTHIDEVIKIIESVPNDKNRKLFSKKESRAKLLAEKISKINSSCLICEKIDYTLRKFADVFWYLCKNDPDFMEKVLAGKGFCLHHFQLLLERADGELGASSPIVDKIIDLELESLSSLGEDTSWFTKKFDYRYTDAPWKNSKDAIPRAIRKLSKFDDQGE